MKGKYIKYAIAHLFVAGICFASEPSMEEAFPPEGELQVSKVDAKDIDVSKMSEAFGHMVGKNLEMLGFEFEVTKVIQGIQDALAGKDSPMTEAECIQAMSVLQEHAHQKLAKENLSVVEEFFAKNAKEEGVKQIEPLKLHYRVEKEGKGEVVQETFSPVIHYKGSFIDGKVFAESQEDEHISLEETIAGFSKGLVGMKEGEKRTLYIHPELAYKDTSAYFPPNSLLTFEVELVKANAPMERESNLAVDEDDLLESLRDEVVQADDVTPQKVAR